MARAEHGRSLAGFLLALVLGLAAVTAIAALAVRPTRLTGVSDGALEASFDRNVRSTEASRCTEDREQRWACVTAEGNSQKRAYEVEVDGWGCWEARGAGTATAHEACITIRDYIKIE